MNLGWMEITVIIILALLFFGPSRLPGLGKSMGEAIRGFKKGISGKDEEPPQRDVTELNHESKSEKDQQNQTNKHKQT